MNRDRIEKLQAQIAEISAELEALKAKAEPEWVPFPGEMIEVRSSDEDSWRVRIATGEAVGGRVQVFCDGEMGGQFMGWGQARPLSDPNVIQFRPHNPKNPMPCNSDTNVVARLLGGTIRSNCAAAFIWSQITAWAPLPKVPV